MTARDQTDPEVVAELEDRAAELVDRDHLHNLERDDWRAARAALMAADIAALTAAADRWEDIKARSGWPSDYGWDSHWTDVL